MCLKDKVWSTMLVKAKIYYRMSFEVTTDVKILDLEDANDLRFLLDQMSRDDARKYQLYDYTGVNDRKGMPIFDGDIVRNRDRTYGQVFYGHIRVDGVQVNTWVVQIKNSDYPVLLNSEFRVSKNQ